MKILLLFVLLSVLSPCISSLPHVFYFVPVNMSWLGAQNYCRQHYTDLATIDDQTDVDELVSAVSSDFLGKQIWIGLYRKVGTASWIWSDQSNSVFSWWDSRQPNYLDGNQYCVATSPAGFWNNRNCGNKYTFICYSVRKRTTVRVEVKSSQNVNNPGVKEEILQKIEQKLKEKGLAENATLSWRNQSDGNVFKNDQKNATLIDQTCN